MFPQQISCKLFGSGLSGSGAIRVMFPETVRANPVAEFCLGVLAYIGLKWLPITLIVTDFFAMGAYGQHPLQGLYLDQGVLKQAIGMQDFKMSFNQFLKLQQQLFGNSLSKCSPLCPGHRWFRILPPEGAKSENPGRKSSPA